jgi:hypothetical protein
MDADHCPICDRPDCQRYVRKTEGRKVTSRMYIDCYSHAVNWRARALAAEGRLRTLDRMAHDDDDMDDDDLRIATESGWEYRGKTLATIGDLADAWADAHKEEA